jgi:hypothetical protein
MFIIIFIIIIFIMNIFIIILFIKFFDVEFCRELEKEKSGPERGDGAKLIFLRAVLGRLFPPT